ncbi:hypothetical protein, partial [Burkholderia thailandensis]|uniref:hypothetical protein n=1 Tax=Burkholderia thailandensis TaxID=57975 RepID=UPI00217DFF74
SSAVAGEKFLCAQLSRQRRNSHSNQVRAMDWTICLQLSLQENWCSGDTLGDKESLTGEGFSADFDDYLQLSNDFCSCGEAKTPGIICTMDALSGY